MPRIKFAKCHPEKEEVALGLCSKCYTAMKKAPKDEVDIAKRNELKILHEQVEHVTALAKEARAILRENLPLYAELHFEAAAVAAAGGDARPAEWALANIKNGKEGRVVEPAPKVDGSGSGVKIFVGVQLGGIPAQISATTETVDASE